MKWEQMQRVEAGKFRRLVGVSPAVFERMRAAALAAEPISTHPIRGAKRGRKPKLALEDRLLMLLMYYREYRTFAHVGASFGVSEAQSWRVVTDLEKRLLADGRFHLARKQSLRNETHWQGVVIDVGECACERPKKSSAPATRARKSAIR
jgi:Helix-turn-helix of DDE superfamily endonuclease